MKVLITTVTGSVRCKIYIHKSRAKQTANYKYCTSFLCFVLRMLNFLCKHLFNETVMIMIMLTLIMIKMMMEVLLIIIMIVKLIIIFTVKIKGSQTALVIIYPSVSPYKKSTM